MWLFCSYESKWHGCKSFVLIQFGKSSRFCCFIYLQYSFIYLFTGNLFHPRNQQLVLVQFVSYTSCTSTLNTSTERCRELLECSQFLWALHTLIFGGKLLEPAILSTTPNCFSFVFSGQSNGKLFTNGYNSSEWQEWVSSLHRALLRCALLFSDLTCWGDNRLQ